MTFVTSKLYLHIFSLPYFIDSDIEIQYLKIIYLIPSYYILFTILFSFSLTNIN